LIAVIIMAEKKEVKSYKKASRIWWKHLKEGWVVVLAPPVRSRLDSVMKEIEDRFFPHGGFKVLTHRQHGKSYMFDLSRLAEAELSEMIDLIEANGIEGLERSFRDAHALGKGIFFSFEIEEEPDTGVQDVRVTQYTTR